MNTMTFAAADIRSGDLLAWEPSPWPETPQYWLVRLATENRLCHVAVAYVRRAKVLMIESDIPHVRMARLEERLPVWWLPLANIAQPWGQEQAEIMLDLIGTPYGYLDAVRQWLGVATQDGDITCLELARQSLILSGVKVGGTRHLMPDPFMAEFAERAKAEPVLLT
jgi:hypothetical protein